MIELIIALPILIFVAMGMAEFGQYFYIKNAFQSAARSAARVACVASALQSDPATAATNALSYAGVTFNSSWMLIIDLSSGSLVTDVSTIPPGHIFTVIIQQTYDQLPNVYRPLYQITGQGIKNGKQLVGQTTTVKE